MDSINRNLLEKRIESELKGIDSLEIDQRGYAIDDIVKLYKLRLDEMKSEDECTDKTERRIIERSKFELEEEELKLKRDQLQIEQELKEKDLELRKEQFQTEIELKEEELKIKRDQLQIEQELKDLDNERMERQLHEQNIDRWVNVGIQLGVTLIGICAYDRWYRRGLKFEETGTIGSPMTRNLLSKMLPKGKN